MAASDTNGQKLKIILLNGRQVQFRKRKKKVLIV